MDQKIKELAFEVIQGKWGNGEERKARLKAAGHDPAKIQAIVNDLLKSDEAIARDVMLGKWGNGEERKARLKAAGHDPAKIQAIVNSMAKKK